METSRTRLAVGRQSRVSSPQLREMLENLSCSFKASTNAVAGDPIAKPGMATRTVKLTIRAGRDAKLS